MELYALIMAEFVVQLINTSRLTYLFASAILYHIAQSLYSAYSAIGAAAFVVTLLIYLPFVVSLARMAWRDTETRRLIFFRNCVKLWLVALLIDVWVTTALDAEFFSQCHYLMNEADDNSIRHQLDYGATIPVDIYSFICKQRLKMGSVRAYLMQHTQFACLLFLARRHWTNKHKTRIKDYKRQFLLRIMSGHVRSHDWLEILPNSQAREALGPDFNAQLWAIRAILRRKQVLNSIKFFDDNIKARIDQIGHNN